MCMHPLRTSSVSGHVVILVTMIIIEHDDNIHTFCDSETQTDCQCVVCAGGM